MKKRPTGDSDGDDDAICCLSFSLAFAISLHWRVLGCVALHRVCFVVADIECRASGSSLLPPPPLRIVSVYAAASVWTMVRNRTTHLSTSSSISSSSLAMIIFLIVYRVHYYIVLSSVSVYQQATSSTLTWPFSCRMSSRPPSPSKALIRIGNKTFCCKFRLLFLFLVELFVFFSS